MDAPLVGVLSRGLIFEKWQQSVLSESRAGVKIERPCREDNVHRTDILIRTRFNGYFNPRRILLTPSLEISEVQNEA